MSAKRKHVTLTLEDKCKIIKRLDSGESLGKLASEYGVGKSTVFDIKSKRDKIISHCSRTECGPGKRQTLRTAENVDVEQALYTWIVQQRAKNNMLSGDIIAEKARHFYREMIGNDNFQASSGWVWNFKKRFGIRVLSLTGEKVSSDDNAFELFKTKFQNEISEKGFNREQVYNVDESGLYWKSLPRKTLVLAGEKEAPGRKISKERITFFPCANAAGTHKLRMAVIGKSKNPRPFKNFVLPVTYFSQKSAWMNRQIFLEWFHNDFVTSVRNHLKAINLPQKAILLLDNCPGHPAAEDLVSDDKNIYAVYLPPNVTALGQPMDQHVIAGIKSRYKKSMLYSVVSSDESLEIVMKRLTIKDAVINLVKAWDETSQGNIVSSWCKLWPLPQRPPNENSSDALVPDIVHVLQAVHKQTDDLITEDDVNEWLNEEEAGLGNEILSDAEIIQRVREEAESGDEEADHGEEEPTQSVKHAEAMQAFNTCLAWADENNIPVPQILNLRRLRDEAFRKSLKKAGQKTIQDFFK